MLPDLERDLLHWDTTYSIGTIQNHLLLVFELLLLRVRDCLHEFLKGISEVVDVSLRCGVLFVMCNQVVELGSSQ